MSFNFDAAWQRGDISPWKAHHDDRSVCVDIGSHAEYRRLNFWQQLTTSNASPARVWYPNGYAQNSGSMRFGLRDFGLQPVAIQSAVTSIMEFEYKQGAKAGDNAFSSYAKRISLILEGQESLHSALNEAKLPLSWVTEVLYRPLVFAGLGLSQSESGLWWLLVQRARNLANVPPKYRPPVLVLIHKNDARLSFWQTRPCGIVPLICDNWEDGWRMVEDWGSQLPSPI